MSTFRVIAVSIVFALLIAARGAWTTVIIGAAASRPAAVSHTTAIPDGPVGGTDRNQDLEVPAVDLFGNEVDEAVGDYRVDIRGDIYERHSPDTEVTKLRPAVG